MRRLIRTAALASAAALALVGAGCGNKHHTVTEAKTEGIWVDVGELEYHIQGSRQLTPSMVPDDSYLMGLPQGILPAGAKETWFAVFLRIENRSGEARPTAEEFEIVDTEDDVYKPLQLDTDANPFAYRPVTLADGDAVPRPDSSQETNSAAGALLLFKLPIESYSNRPLTFRIKAPQGGGEPAEAQIDLDV